MKASLRTGGSANQKVQLAKTALLSNGVTFMWSPRDFAPLLVVPLPKFEARLYLSEGTVRNCLSEAIHKLNGRNRIEPRVWHGAKGGCNL
ncbi:MAG: hypothetical protein NVS4B2_35530 [Chloroflexota bacterium]